MDSENLIFTGQKCKNLNLLRVSKLALLEFKSLARYPARTAARGEFPRLAGSPSQ